MLDRGLALLADDEPSPRARRACSRGSAKSLMVQSRYHRAVRVARRRWPSRRSSTSRAATTSTRSARSTRSASR